MRQALGPDLAAVQIDPRLKELSFGDWEGETIAEIRARDPAAIAARARDKWSFEPPHGESYAQEDTVAVAHGGTARALMVVLGLVPPATAPLIDVEQGVVYAFEAHRVMIHR